MRISPRALAMGGAVATVAGIAALCMITSAGVAEAGVVHPGPAPIPVASLVQSTAQAAPAFYPIHYPQPTGQPAPGFHPLDARDAAITADPLPGNVIVRFPGYDDGRPPAPVAAPRA